MHLPPRHIWPLVASILTSAFSMAAGGMISIAFPWLIISGGGSAALAGVTSFILLLSWALGTGIAGGLMERHGSPKTLLAADAVACSLLLPAIGVILLLPETPYLAIPFLAVSNVGGAISTVVLQARVPEMARLARTTVERATGLREIALNLGYMAGPAGMVALIDGAGFVAGLSVVTVLLGAVWLADRLTFPSFRVIGPSQVAGARRRAWHILLSNRILARLCVFALLSSGLFISLDEIVAPAFFVAGGFQGGAVALFLLTSGFAAMSAAACYTLWGEHFALRPLIVFAQVMVAAGLLLLVLLPAELARWLAPLAIGFGGGSLWPMLISQVLRRVRRKESGRAVGALGTAIMLTQPASSLIAGTAVDLAGPEAVLLFFAGLLLLPLALLGGSGWK